MFPQNPVFYCMIIFRLKLANPYNFYTPPFYLDKMLGLVHPSHNQEWSPKSSQHHVYCNLVASFFVHFFYQKITFPRSRLDQVQLWRSVPMPQPSIRRFLTHRRHHFGISATAGTEVLRGAGDSLKAMHKRYTYPTYPHGKVKRMKPPKQGIPKKHRAIKLTQHFSPRYQHTSLDFHSDRHQIPTKDFGVVKERGQSSILCKRG